MTLVTAFTGHRVDAPERRDPRFPAALAPAVQAAMAKVVSGQCAVSSAANGGDLLFLELCQRRGIDAHIVLPMPPAEFVARSVRTDAPGDWEARFAMVWQATPADRRHILSLDADQNPFAACNRAVLDLAMELGDRRQLVALWDGETGDGSGGTADMIALARQRKCDVTISDPALIARQAS